MSDMDLSKWEIVSSPNKKQMNLPSENDLSGWEIVPSEQPKESYGTSFLYAPFRIGQDILQKGYEGIQSLPSRYEQYKTELPGFWQNIVKHPGHMALQGLAGANELINSINQFPVAMANYEADRLHLWPQSAKSLVKKIVPEDTTQAINQLFGQPQYPGEALFRGTVRNAPTIAGIGKSISNLNPSNLIVTKNRIKNNLLNVHDTLEHRASDAFNTVSKEVERRGLDKVNTISPVNEAPLFNEQNIESLRDYFPKTKATEGLLQDAKSGSYNALRRLQADLYKRGKKNLSSAFDADRMRGAEMLEKRNDIIDAISSHLKNTGSHDLDSLLNGARTDWRTLQNIYYNENMPNSLINMFDKNYRKIPNNLINLLSQESIPMKNLLDFHPGLEQQVARHKLGKTIFKKGVKYGIPAATAFGGYEYGKNR
jgi:hypothetical protein